MRVDAVVAGGGVAGILAALDLAGAGRRVALCEATRRLGGRAFSFGAPGLGGAEVENGAHALVGAYKELRRLLGVLGTEERFRRPRALALGFLDRGRLCRLRASSWLPGPWNLLAGVLGFAPLGAREKIRTLQALAGLLLGPASDDRPVAAWLGERKLAGAPARALLVPLCRAILNTAEEEASLTLFAAALRESLRGRAGRGALWLPAAPWREILDEPAQRVLAARGVQVLLGAPVAGLRERGKGVRLRDGRELEARAVVWAAPPWAPGFPLPERGKGLQPTGLGTLFIRLRERRPWPDPVLILTGKGPFQFAVAAPDGGEERLTAFILTPWSGPPPGGCPAGAAGLALAPLQALFPRLAAAGQAWVPQPRGVLHQPAGQAGRRPAVAAGPEGLFFAGDWVETGLPATLEAAARAGAAAAAAVESYLGRDGKD